MIDKDEDSDKYVLNRQTDTLTTRAPGGAKRLMSFCHKSQTDRHTDIVTPRAPDGAKKIKSDFPEVIIKVAEYSKKIIL